ncbi:MAG: aminotransferase class I/II-fold pyridoxal phosphate-dependent enzyme [Ilumatobacteraceae bacterium]
MSGVGRHDVPPAGAHGGDAARIAAWLGRPAGDMLDLSASLNPVAPDVAPIVAANLDRLDRYPDPTQATEALAGAIGVDPDVLVLTNGGSEAIALVAADAPVGMVAEPEFSLYRRHLATVDAGAPWWRSNPSSPLGRLAPADVTARVWDEAFYPLAAGAWTRGDADCWRLGSLTKVWACPGLRIGYAIAPGADAAARLRRRQPQWSVNGLALAVVEGLAAASDPAAWSLAVAGLRGELVAALRSRGLAVDDTDACWVLVQRPGLRELLAPHGVVVRDCASFGLAGVTRIAVPDGAGLDRLLAVLDRVL